MVSEQCSFETDRLFVDEWHSASWAGDDEQALPDVVASLMSASVTRALPAEWQGEYTPHRARQWVAERDREGPTLLAVERSSAEVVGLLIPFESEAPEGSGVGIRLGYMLAESAWGQGLGSELVEGFVAWCRAQTEIRSIIAGVAADNPASIRILEKSGFAPNREPADDPTAERIFQLQLP
jgi:ribosomal-protein-alanine N-acetyltransferase